MSAVSKLNKKTDSSSKPSAKESNKENPNPSGSIITGLVLIAVLVSIAGIVFHFLKKKKPQEKELSNSKIKGLDENVTSD